MSTLSTQEKSLLRQALAARENAYAPYSRFQVGAVLTVADGSTFCGCNIENASYSMTICAERSSVCAAVSAGVRQFRSIAIVGGVPEWYMVEIFSKGDPPAGQAMISMATPVFSR